MLPLASHSVTVMAPGKYQIGAKSVSRDQMLHLRRHTDDLSIGQSDITLCANARANAYEFDRFLSKMLRNDNLSQTYLHYEGPKKALTREERTQIQSEWVRDTQSPYPPVVHQVKPEEMGVKSSDININDIKSALMTDICNILGIPPGLLGVSATTASQASDDRQRFLDYCIHPIMTRLCAQLSRWSRPEHYVEACYDNLVKPNMEARYSAYATGLQYGFLTHNEVRSRENLTLVDGGDQLNLPANIYGYQDEVKPIIPEAKRLVINKYADATQAPKHHPRRKKLKHVADELAVSYSQFYRDTARRLVSLSGLAATMDAVAAETILPTVKAGELALLEEILKQTGLADDKHVRDLIEKNRYDAIWVRSELIALQEYEVGLEDLRELLDRKSSQDMAGLAMDKVTHSDAFLCRKLYQANGVQYVGWGAGASACDACKMLAAKGPVSIQSAFGSTGESFAGATQGAIWINGELMHPPLHPGCECWLIYYKD